MPPEIPDLTGVVVAGGYSRRYRDREKALVRVGGTPLLARVVARLGTVASTVVVNCRADQREAFETALAPTDVPVRFVEDPTPDRGPLFGFRTALRAVETGRCALATCDVPFLDPRLVSDLAARLDSGADAVVVRTPDGRVHPAQAVYRTAPAESACEALLDAGERRLSAVFDRLVHRVVPAEAVAGDASRSLFDVDSPEDREEAVELLREGGAEMRDEQKETELPDEQKETDERRAAPPR